MLLPLAIIAARGIAPVVVTARIVIDTVVIGRTRKTIGTDAIGAGAVRYVAIVVLIADATGLGPLGTDSAVVTLLAIVDASVSATRAVGSAGRRRRVG